MGIRAADDLVLLQPVQAHGTQETQRCHKVRTVEDVVDDSLEIEGVVGAVHLTVVDLLQAELVDQFGLARRGADPGADRSAEPGQKPVVAVILQILVVHGYAPVH